MSRASSISNLQFGGTMFGCMGDKSVPRMVVSGYLSAKSIAQIPVPVPISRTLCDYISRGSSPAPDIARDCSPRCPFLLKQVLTCPRGVIKTCDGFRISPYSLFYGLIKSHLMSRFSFCLSSLGHLDRSYLDHHI